jgi:hypothetical protein
MLKFIKYLKMDIYHLVVFQFTNKTIVRIYDENKEFIRKIETDKILITENQQP